MSFQKKINISIIILLVLSLLSIFFLIYPSFLEIKKIANDLISLKGNLIFLETKIKNLEEFRKKYQSLKKDLEKIDKIFINADLPIDFISFLEKDSQDCGLIVKISPLSLIETQKDPWPSIGFQITAAGSSPNFLKFLEKLESSQYLIEIQNLNIVRLSELELKTKEFEKLSPGDVKTLFSLKVFTK